MLSMIRKQLKRRNTIGSCWNINSRLTRYTIKNGLLRKKLDLLRERNTRKSNKRKGKPINKTESTHMKKKLILVIISLPTLTKRRFNMGLEMYRNRLILKSKRS